jgi:hypothetical protein
MKEREKAKEDIGGIETIFAKVSHPAPRGAADLEEYGCIVFSRPLRFPPHLHQRGYSLNSDIIIPPQRKRGDANEKGGTEFERAKEIRNDKEPCKPWRQQEPGGD